MRSLTVLSSTLSQFLAALATIIMSTSAIGQTVQNVTAQCIDCHAKVTPNIVNDWKQSHHSQVEVGCDTCHGSEHMNAEDSSKAKIPTPETCGQCHQTQVEQFTKGKHARHGLQWKQCQLFTISQWQ